MSEQHAGNLFAAIPPREVSGSRSSSGFDFQKDWAICKLVELHQSREDFLLVPEHHEDVVVFDTPDTPLSIEFFQIKKSKSGWTVGRLCIKPKGKDSIIEKLFQNHQQVDRAAVILAFESNQGFNQYDQDKKILGFADLTVKDKEKIHRTIEGEDCVVSDFQGLRKIHLIRCGLSYDDHDTHVLGILTNYLEDKYPGLKVKLAYRLLFDEIKRRTNLIDTSGDWMTLQRTKGISKDMFQEMLVQMSQSSREVEFSEIRACLLAEGVPPLEIARLQSPWIEYRMAKMDPFNSKVESQASLIVAAIHQCYSDDPGINYWDLANNVLETMQEQGLGLSDNYLRVATIFEALCYEPLSSTDTEPEEEAE